MRKIISITVLIFLLQATFGLMAHCSSPIEDAQSTKALSMQMHYVMQSGDIQDADKQHDCCDEGNDTQTQFSDSCDCESGVIHALVTLEAFDKLSYSVQYFSAVVIPHTEPQSFRLLRPPILT